MKKRRSSWTKNTGDPAKLLKLLLPLFALIGALVGFFQLFFVAPLLSVTPFIFTVVSGILYWFLVRTNRFVPVAHALVILVYVLLLGSSVLTGFFESSMVIAYMSLPGLALFLLGRRIGLVWLILTLATVLVGFILDRAGFQFSASSFSKGTEQLKTLAIFFATLVGIYLTLDQARLDVIRSETKAREASHAKTNFLSSMSHEIRTPLTAIIGFSQLLNNKNITDLDKGKFAQTIQRNSKHLKALVDDILDLAKIESGKTSFEWIRFNIKDHFEDVFSLLRSQAAIKKLVLRVDYKFGLPKSIVSDPTRISQILTNVLANAVKFTDQGYLAVQVETYTDLSTNRQVLRVDMSDTGSGMSPVQQQRLFKPFSQADASISGKYGGTGLGLAISKNLALAMDGDLILLSSHPGQGSTFRLTLSLGEDRVILDEVSPTRSADIKLELKKRKILIIDDNDDSLELATRVMEGAGAQVLACSKGAEGIACALREEPDIILVDIEMPEKNGFEVLRRIRSQGLRKPVVALTAKILKAETDEIQKAGFDDYVTKPYDAIPLLKTLKSILSISS